MRAKKSLLDRVKRPVLALQESQTIVVDAIPVPGIDLRESVRFAAFRQIQQPGIRKALNLIEEP
jgi:hypothetical protein